MILGAVTSVHKTEELVFFTLLQLIVILLAARGCGWVARKVGQPRVVGEIIGGILLGPSLLGKLMPGTFQYLFHSTDGTALMILSQIGLILLMFQIGLEFDFHHLSRPENKRTVVAVSWVGIALPFVLGLGLGYIARPVLAPDIHSIGFYLFMAVALSITAIPILGRIMIDFDLNRTRLGAITITAAAFDDVTGWVLLAVVSALTAAKFSGTAFAQQIALLLVYVAVSWWVIRPLLLKIIDRFQARGDGLSHGLMALILALIFVSGLITYKLGVFAIFGGFVLGVLLHDHAKFVAAWRERVVPVVTVFFLPIFFTFTGLRTNVGSLDSPALWFWCAMVIVAATAGKFIGCTGAAKVCGLPWADSVCIGIMMNTRALMELVVVNVGFEMGVIPQSVFTMLVLMAIFSTVVTAPTLRYYLKRMGHIIPHRHD